jgi:hypothetical protein
MTTDDGRYVMAYPDKFGLAFEPTKTKLELADLKLDWHIALMRGLSTTYCGYGLSWGRKASTTMRK